MSEIFNRTKEIASFKEIHEFSQRNAQFTVVTGRRRIGKQQFCNDSLQKLWQRGKVTREYTLDVLPLFVKAGSILPIGPRIQYATEETDQPMELRIYPGKDASFTLYEDDNETYDYEKGEYATIEFKWNDKDCTLSISDQEGTFKGIRPDKTFHVTTVDGTHGIGLDPSHPARVIEYCGKSVVVKL